jgi:Family of unknown function (DUF6510)
MHTDGNHLGGLLREIFTGEMTSAMRECESCHHRTPIGAHRLYRGAGHVLRCPMCGDLAALVVERTDGYVLSLRGTWLVDRVE